MQNHKPGLTVLAILMALVGCSTPPQPPAQVSDLPTRWLAAPAEADLALSVVPWLAPELTALQQQALVANRDIAKAALRWQQAKLNAAQADLRLQPSLSLSSNSGRPLDRGSDWQRSFGLTGGVAYEVDLWGRLADADAAQLAQADSARTDIAAAKALILSQVAERYWTLAANAAQQPLIAEAARHAEEALQITSLRVREGKMLPIEVDKAAATLQAAQVRLSDLQADRQLQSMQLALLLDQPPPGPLLQEPQVPPQAPPAWRLDAPAKLLAGRPDVQRARLAVDAALARLRVAQAERYPRLSFSATASSGGGSEWYDWLKQPVASLAASLTVPLIDWRRLELSQAGAQSELEIAALSLRDTLYKSLTEVESQLIERERLQQQYRATELRLREARQAEQLAELRMQVGSIARIDWLQARDARLTVEGDLLQLQLRRWLNHAGMFKVLGIELWSDGAL
ncbi:TolC family protein [Paucibacter sp. B2R-40]|uniref:TolC family protein n=1 Tax=Paucibacter sp. B2R-40 TaxID=2893554 RepID=UPI0021E48949|nr:TolC family protein [Paucibacter sp. B2R-40]MCV2353079.1 TolC family protein [Paucibacter sp. B2R-40]